MSQPTPAPHQTGRADFPPPAFREPTSQSDRRQAHVRGSGQRRSCPSRRSSVKKLNSPCVQSFFRPSHRRTRFCSQTCWRPNTRVLCPSWSVLDQPRVMRFTLLTATRRSRSTPRPVFSGVMAMIQMGAYLDATSAARPDDFRARSLLLAREWKRLGLGTPGCHRIFRDFGHQKNRSHRELSVVRTKESGQKSPDQKSGPKGSCVNFRQH